MANTNLISLLKASQKNDSFRGPEQPSKYVNTVAQLNSVGSEQYLRINGNFVNVVNKTNTSISKNGASVGVNLPK